MTTEPIDSLRRNFLAKAAYVAPAILTLAAAPAYAKSGSDKNPIATGPKPPGKR